MQPDIKEIDRIIAMSLKEDLGRGDITSNLTIDEELNTEFYVRVREEMVVCGIAVAARVFEHLSSDGELSSGCEGPGSLAPV